MRDIKLEPVPFPNMNTVTGRKGSSIRITGSGLDRSSTGGAHAWYVGSLGLTPGTRNP